MTKEKDPYLPKMRTDYHPTTSDCQTSTDVGTTDDIPSPAVDPIVVNNISNAEFDYTQDMITSDYYDLDSDTSNSKKNSKNSKHSEVTKF